MLLAGEQTARFFSTGGSCPLWRKAQDSSRLVRETLQMKGKHFSSWQSVRSMQYSLPSMRLIPSTHTFEAVSTSVETKLIDFGMERPVKSPATEKVKHRYKQSRISLGYLVPSLLYQGKKPPLWTCALQFCQHLLLSSLVSPWGGQQVTPAIRKRCVLPGPVIWMFKHTCLAKKPLAYGLGESV